MEIELPRSPKRRRILASINPPEPGAGDSEDSSRRRKRDHRASANAGLPQVTEDDSPAQPEQAEQKDLGITAPRPTKFRFKSKSSKSSSRRHRQDDDYDGDDRRRRHRHHHHHHRRERSRDRAQDRDRDGDAKDGSDRPASRRRRHRHRRRSRSPTSSPPHPGAKKNDPFASDPPLDPETAFRESLFDALADDEGAAYWEAVYGQPIHIYGPPPSGGGGGGPLERMTDDEYAAYVRQKMWEKTHAGLLEARARREKEAEEARRRTEEAARIAREMEASLRRGEERRRRKAWRDGWDTYLRAWAAWDASSNAGGPGAGVEAIPWPGEDRTAEGVRAFFVHGLRLEEVGEKEFAARLKEERVRWHPDKMQQRLGGKVDDEVMRHVTGIFQVVDALWNDTRKHGG